MKIITIGNKVFVTTFRLAGIQGIIVSNPKQALDEIKKAMIKKAGLILLSDDMSNPINDQLTLLRSQKAILVFSLPNAGSKKEDVDYRLMLKKILGV